MKVLPPSNRALPTTLRNYKNQSSLAMAGVVIFDSGVGGLSIYQEIKELLSADQPHQQASRRDREAQPLIFFSDNAAYPYGLKSDQHLLDRVAKVADAINDEFQPSGRLQYSQLGSIAFATRPACLRGGRCGACD